MTGLWIHRHLNTGCLNLFFHLQKRLLFKNSDDKYEFKNEFNVKSQTFVLQTNMRPETKAITASSCLCFPFQSQSGKIKHNVRNLQPLYSYNGTADCLFICYDGPEYLFYLLLNKRLREHIAHLNQEPLLACWFVITWTLSFNPSVFVILYVSIKLSRLIPLHGYLRINLCNL